MGNNYYKTKEDLLSKSQEVIGIPLGDIDKSERLKTGKGAIGTVIEESCFGYNVNSKSEPDFSNLGVELKVTPFLRTKSGIRAKERLVCNIINYEKESIKTFETSSFWLKCQNMLLMFYEHKWGVPKEEFYIEKSILYEFPEADLRIIKKDWEVINKKIRSGQAHEISERDTLYLGACTKGVNALSIRKQPESDILAKQRAYSLKQSYMTSVLQRFVFNNKEEASMEKFIKDNKAFTEKGFVGYIESKFYHYLGTSQSELKRHLDITTSGKSLNNTIAGRILEVNNIDRVEEFAKANIKIKTIRLESDGVTIAEDMSFPTFKFEEIITKEWEESNEYQYLVEQKYLFIVFNKDSEYNLKDKDDSFREQHLFLNKIVLWQLPEEHEKEVRRVWEETVKTIKNGVVFNILKTKSGCLIKNNLPKSKNSHIAHIRPHAPRSGYKIDGVVYGNLASSDRLPDGNRMTKQCIWLNRTYISKQLFQNSENFSS